MLLQVAHPLVAAGVVQHSDFRRDLWHRLIRTLGALYLITYGSKEEADRAGQAVQAVHEHVRGETLDRLGRFPAGTRYSASDPELQLWVHATLVESSLAAYQRFVRRLARDEQERYYREMSVVARLFGVPAEVLPRSLSEFREYFSAQIAGDTITVTLPARAVADVIVEARLPAPMRVLVPAHRLATAGLLPERLRREYGLRWSAAARARAPAGGAFDEADRHAGPLRGGTPRLDSRRPRRIVRPLLQESRASWRIDLAMMFEEREVIEEAADRWWLFLLTGIGWLIVALIVFQWNYTTVYAVSFLFGFVALFAGLNEFFQITVSTSGWKIVHGILGVLFILAAVWAFVHPHNAFATLAALIAFFILIKGIFDITVAFVTKDQFELWWLQLIVGLLEILLAFWVAGSFRNKVILLVAYVGIIALSRGITEIFLAFKLKGLRRRVAVA